MSNGLRGFLFLKYEYLFLCGSFCG